jgi:hypothetical protein
VRTLEEFCCDYIRYSMNLSGGSACVKYLLFIFNLIFVVSAINMIL